jgi:predicted amidohydrolase YtcJ
MGSIAIVNGNILTMEPSQPVAEAALVQDGRIAAVGTSQDVLAAAKDTGKHEVFDCAGKTVVPGFIDGHAHFEMTCWALTHCLSCPVPPFQSLAEIEAALSQRVERTPPGEWIIARSSFGLQGKVPEQRLFTRHDLDAITTTHPLVVLSGFHVAMLNTRGLKELGLWERAGNPPRGITIHREESGAPNGIATEIWPMLPAFPKEMVKSAIREQLRDQFLAHGITSIHNLPFSADDMVAVQELQEAGELPMRLRFFYHIPHQIELDALLALGLKPGFGNDMLRYGGIKIFIDGIGSDGLGTRLWDVKWDPEELNEFVSRAHAAGQQLWMHALRIESLRMGADAVEVAIERAPIPHRHRIEHSADFINETEDMQRLRDLGIWVVTTPQFLYSVGNAQSRRESGHRRLRRLIDHGFEVIGSSDTTGTVPDGIAPLFNIACALNSAPGEDMTVDEAIRMFTIWAARGAFEEGDKGSIAVGKLGDFAVLSADPREVPTQEVFDIQVDATILGGNVVFQR